MPVCLAECDRLPTLLDYLDRVPKGARLSARQVSDDTAIPEKAVYKSLRQLRERGELRKDINFGTMTPSGSWKPTDTNANPMLVLAAVRRREESGDTICIEELSLLCGLTIDQVQSALSRLSRARQNIRCVVEMLNRDVDTMPDELVTCSTCGDRSLEIQRGGARAGSCVDCRVLPLGYTWASAQAEFAKRIKFASKLKRQGYEPKEIVAAIDRLDGEL